MADPTDLAPDATAAAPPPRPSAAEALARLKAEIAELVTQHHAERTAQRPVAPPPARDQPGGDALPRFGGIPGITVDYSARPDSSFSESVPINRLAPADMQGSGSMEAQGGHTDYRAATTGGGGYRDPETGGSLASVRSPGFNYQQTGPTPMRIADGSAGPRSVAEIGHVNSLLRGEGDAGDAASSSKQGMYPQTYSTSDVMSLYRDRPRSPVPNWLLQQQREAQSAIEPLHGEAFPSAIFKGAGIAASMLPVALPAKFAPLIGGVVGAIAGAPQVEAAPKPQTTLPGVPKEINDEYARLLKKVKNGDFESSADRQATMDRLKEIRGLSNSFVTGQQNSGRAEYDRRVAEAEAAKNKELAREYHFPDTTLGRAWRTLGPAGPATVGAVAGGLTRLATGPGASFVGKAVKDYIAPMVMGTLAGGASANAPLVGDLMGAPSSNPEKAAYQRAAFLLPDGHPDKQRFKDYADSLPDLNPVRKAASDEFYDWEKAKERMAVGGLEGFVGSALGSDPVRIGSRAWNWAKGMFGGGGQGQPPPGGGAGGPQAPGGGANPGGAGTANEPISSQQGTPEPRINRLLQNMREGREAASPERQPSGLPPTHSQTPWGIRGPRGRFTRDPR